MAAILRPSEVGPEVLFIRRAEHPNDPWSGHMAFPGGRREPTDDDLIATAVRETREEVGLDLPAQGQLLGELTDVPTHTQGLVVRPFVWWVRELQRPLSPNEEVAGLKWVDLRSMMEGNRDTTFHFEWKGQSHALPGYTVEDRVVWGLTYRMLQQLFAAIRGAPTPGGT